MPLLPFVHQPIVQVVADRQAADTRIRQVATFVTLFHSQAPDGTCRAVITVLVTMHAAEGEGVGPQLNGAGFSSYTRDLTADNLSLVDATTGAILATRKGENPAAWQAIIDGFPQDTMLQGDFFEYLRDNGLPGTIRQMIEQHIRQADAMGLFA